MIIMPIRAFDVNVQRPLDIKGQPDRFMALLAKESFHKRSARRLPPLGDRGIAEILLSKIILDI
jgi:hypothetical protein